MSTPRELLPTALKAVSLARELVHNRPVGVVTAKGDRDMVSEMDLAIERAVRDFLQRETPSIGFLGEEEGATAGDDELMWTLDPIDGTANFVHGLPLCGISLGLVQGKRPVLGVIDLPFLETRYSAAEHHGAYANEQRLHTSPTSSLSDAVVALGDYAVGADAAPKNRLRLALTEQLAAKAQRVRMLGSVAIDLAWVAEGKLDASITLSNKPWDMAAGVIIAREAGAQVIDRDGSPYTLDSTATIAITASLLDEIRDLLQELDAKTAQPGASYRRSDAEDSNSGRRDNRSRSC